MQAGDPEIKKEPEKRSTVIRPALTETLAERVVGVRYRDFPQVVIDRAKELMLDGLGNMLAGSVQPLGRVLTRFLIEVGGNAHSTAIGTGIKTSPPWAALANGACCRTLDYDPTQPGHHPVGANLPASLALAEKQGLPGWRLVEGFVIGVEIQSRTVQAQDAIPTAKTPRARDTVNFYGRGIVGTLSAAMAASKVLGLNVHHTRMALGIAAAKTGGIDSAGTMCNPGDSGNAASRGVQAAMLAQLGFTGRDDVLEYRYGYSQFLGKGADLEAIVRDFPDHLHLAQHPVSIKKYPCQYPTHRHIDAILMLYRKQPWRAEDIVGIEIELTLMPGDSNFNNRSIFKSQPQDGMDGKFSVPYTAAVAAIDGAVGIESFSDEKRWSEAVVAMLPRVSVKISDERPATFNAMWSEVTLRFRNGEARQQRVDLLRGVSGGEPLTREERVAKFMNCALLAIKSDQAQRVAALVEHIETLENLDELCTLLRSDRHAKSKRPKSSGAR